MTFRFLNISGTSISGTLGTGPVTWASPGAGRNTIPGLGAGSGKWEHTTAGEGECSVLVAGPSDVEDGVAIEDAGAGAGC